MGFFFSISINNDKRLINIKGEKQYLFCFVFIHACTKLDHYNERLSIPAFRAYLPSSRHPSCCIHYCVRAMFIEPVVAHSGPREITEGLMSSLCSKDEKILSDHMLPKRWSAVCDGRGQWRLRYTPIDHLSIVVTSPLHRVPNDAQWTSIDD